jgi:uncharacterized GH25 family protein
MKNFLFAATALTLFSAVASAHDTWVETNTNIFRVGDAAHIDLKLGNHGNEHRDFKVASKMSLDGCKMEVIDPAGQHFDIKPSLIDTGYSPKDGFWTTTFSTDMPGLYTVVQSSDAVMNYAPERAIKNAKTFFVVSKSLDRVPTATPGFGRKLGNALELVPETNPVMPMGPGVPIKLRLFFKGKPLPGAKISFIPQGETLKGAFDARYEAKTNINGRVSFTPKNGNRYLAVAHFRTEEKGQNGAGEKYDFTLYGATLTVYVPNLCPCCG